MQIIDFKDLPKHVGSRVKIKILNNSVGNKLFKQDCERLKFTLEKVYPFKDINLYNLHFTNKKCSNGLGYWAYLLDNKADDLEIRLVEIVTIEL